MGFKEEDNKQKDRISAKNGLESYCFNMKTTIEDEKMADEISEDDKKKITDKCDEAIKWLDANQLAEVEEFQDKQRRWRECATSSSPSSTSRLEELHEACLTWEECQVVCQELVQEVLLQEVQDL